MSIVADNLARVRERIALAAAKAGRAAGEVQLVGVTKYVTAQRAAELLQTGCAILGESRPQQLWDKAADAAFESLTPNWHMIGHLQRNKVARTVPLVAMIHSVDSPRLLKAIDDSAATTGSRTKVLLEVNCSGDSEKHGFTPEALSEFASELGNYSSVEICGLMTMAAGDRNLSTAAANFAALREFRDQLAGEVPGAIELAELSMGMSGDFEVAIAEGSTIVRVGSALWEGVE